MDRAALRAMTYTAPPAFTTRPTLEGTFGMSASTHWTATATAQAVLERGGTAFDAAAAAAFVLHVVEPHLGGPGGDLVALFQSGDAAQPRVLMGQGPAPAGASIAHFRSEGLDRVPGAGGLAATVPGGVDAWLLLLRDHGTWELGDVLSFAIGYARDGHPLLPQAAATISRVTGLFREHWPSSADRWLDRGEAPAAGSMVRNPAYAGVLETLVAAAAGEGDRAKRIDAARDTWADLVGTEAAAFLGAPHRHSSGSDHAAVLTADDVRAFRAGYEAAATARFRGATIAKAGAWTQGPALLQVLGMLEPLADELLDPQHPDGAHTILEAQKLAYADRDAWYGDDDVDLAALLSPEYAEERRPLIGEHASNELRPGMPGAQHPRLPAVGTDRVVDASLGVGEPTVSRRGETRGDTCHLDVIDRWGNVVSATPSGGWLQSSPTIPSLGFCLGTRLQMTWLEPGLPSSLRAGRRPRTTLTPTLVRRGDEVFAMGSPGGDQQDQWQLPALLRMLVGGYTPQQAIDAPTLHTTALIDSFWPRTWTPAGAVVEDRLGEDVIASLERRGHRVQRAGDWSLGRIIAVGRRDPGLLWAAANPRGMQGYAAGR